MSQEFHLDFSYLFQEVIEIAICLFKRLQTNFMDEGAPDRLHDVPNWELICFSCPELTRIAVMAGRPCPLKSSISPFLGTNSRL